MTVRDSHFPTSVFVDTSAFVALARTAENKHLEARAIFTQLSQSRIKIFTSNFVIAESHAFLLSKSGRDIAATFITTIDKSVGKVIRVSEEEEERAKQIILRYKDKEFSYTDATSFAIMDNNNLAYCFTFDHHFKQYGFLMLQDIYGQSHR